MCESMGGSSYEILNPNYEVPKFKNEFARISSNYNLIDIKNTLHLSLKIKHIHSQFKVLLIILNTILQTYS